MARQQVVRTPPPTLTREQLGVALAKLSRVDHVVARALYARICVSYGTRLDKEHVTLLQLTDAERALLRKVVPAVVLRSFRYVAVYRTKYKSGGVSKAHTITVKSNEVPSAERTFRVPGHGTRKFKLVSIIDTTKKESNAIMAKNKGTRAAKQNTAPVDEDVEEIEGLEDIEDLEDLEDVAGEEPDTEDTDGEDEDALAGLSVKALRAKAKEAGVKGYSKMGKDDLIAQLSADDEDEEDDEEDEDDGLDELDRSALKALVKSKLGRKAKKSESDDDLRTALRAVSDEDEDDEDEEEPEDTPAPKPPKSSKGKGTGRKPPTPPNRELPAGKVGAARIAELAGKDAREVRVYLRSLGDDAKTKYQVDGRWAFTEKQAAALAKKVKAS